MGQCGSCFAFVPAKMSTRTAQARETTISANSNEELDRVVSVTEHGKHGSISIIGRYVTERAIEADFKFDLKKVLGTGMSGSVLLATGKNGKKCAVKSFKKSQLSNSSRKALENEVRIYLSLDHPHIARLERVYETSEDVHLVMEHMSGGEVLTRLTRRKRYTEKVAADTLHSMLLAVAYLHAHRICHRDLKLENFLYDSANSEHLKLIDFGLASLCPDQTTLRQRCGSLMYVAPEVLTKSYTEQADLWSMGVISFMLLTGEPVFHGTGKKIFRAIQMGQVHYSSPCFQRLSPLAQDFVQKLLVADPTTRLTARGALEHPFIAKRHKSVIAIDVDILGGLRSYAQASHFRRACLSMMAWSLSREDRKYLMNSFLELDTERTGTISLTQFKRVLVDNFRIDAVEAEELVACLDMDHDKELCYSEFLALALQDRLRMHQQALRETFSRFDRQEKGAITVENLRTLLGDTFENVKVEELLREADADGNGSICYNEFANFLLCPGLDTPPDSENEDAKTMDGSLMASFGHLGDSVKNLFKSY